jgi:uncharacterized membrane protein YhhN
MSVLQLVLVALSAISAVAAISVVYRNRKLYAFLKLLTTILIIGAGLASARHFGTFQIALVAGLFFCLLGDIFLLEDKTFVLGLASFLAGHLCFITGFGIVNHSAGGMLSEAWILLPLLVYGAAMYLILAPHLGKMKLPVVVYMVAILLMAWQALTFGVNVGGMATLASAGAVLFVISDSTLAYNRFRREFMPAELLILSTYWSAILLIALSVQAVA